MTPPEGAWTVKTSKLIYTEQEMIVYTVSSFTGDAIFIPTCNSYPMFCMDSLADGAWRTFVDRGTCPSDSYTTDYVEVTPARPYVDSTYSHKRGISRLRIPYTKTWGAEIEGYLATNSFTVY